MFSALFIALIQFAAAETPALSARGALGDAEIPFHRTTYYRVVVEAPAETPIDLEPAALAVPGIALIAREPAERALEGGRKSIEFVWDIAPIGPGTFLLPTVSVRADGAPAATVEPAALSVRALTPEEEAEVRVAQGILFPADLAAPAADRGWPVALIVLAVLALGAAAWRFRSALRWPVRTRPLDPLAEARMRLDELEAALHADGVEIEAIYVALSLILRTYLGRHFAVPALEQSTPEFSEGPLAELPLAPETRRRIRRQLRDADRVKFAGVRPLREQCGAAIAEVRALVALLETAGGNDMRGAA